MLFESGQVDRRLLETAVNLAQVLPILFGF
jgi:hypothetical protein